MGTFSGKIKSEILESLSVSKLFGELKEESKAYVLEKAELSEVEKNRSIDISAGRLLLVVRGELLAVSNNVTLNVLKKGSVTGVSGMFTNGCGKLPTHVTARKNSRLLMLSEKDFEGLLTADPGFSLSFIHFLTDRVRFLNRRLSYFTADSAERRVAGYLADAAEEDGTFVPVNMSKLSGFLNMGRATLYRIVAALEEKGAIKKVDGGVMVESIEKLLEN